MLRRVFNLQYTVISASDHHDAIVPFQSIYLVEEKGFDVVRHNTIDILENEEARACFPRLLEYAADAVLITVFSQ